MFVFNDVLNQRNLNIKKRLANKGKKLFLLYVESEGSNLFIQNCNFAGKPMLTACEAILFWGAFFL